ncbi:TPM domain-containing protein [Acaryochloris thomasi]|nr:TPM domain-containing protein [Acaryochloris thomasi]
MKYSTFKICLTGFLAMLMSLGIALGSPAALATDTAISLPTESTAVLDLAKSLTTVQKENLDQRLADFEQETGWKLRVLTQLERTPRQAIKKLWSLDDHSVLILAQPQEGNILNFSIGDAVYQILPRNFWLEVQNRLGNKYYIQQNGEDQAILTAINSIEVCLRRDGCSVMPGISDEQWVFTLIASILGGLICGFGAQPRNAEELFSWRWALMFSPLWGILFFAFGVAPVMARTSDWLPLMRNIAGFLFACIGVILVGSGPSTTTES